MEVYGPDESTQDGIEQEVLDEGEKDGGPHSHSNSRCEDCWKRRVRGASDVYNSRRRLQMGLKLQTDFLSKHDTEPKPKTWDTRVKLRDYWLRALEDFEDEFAQQIMDLAPVEEAAPENKPTKRKRRRT